MPDSEKDIWYKAKGNRTWKEYLETGLFGEHQPHDLISYDEAQALIEATLQKAMIDYVDQKIAEALSKQK